VTIEGNWEAHPFLKVDKIDDRVFSRPISHYIHSRPAIRGYEIVMPDARQPPVMEHNVGLGCTVLSVVLVVSLTACRQSPREPVTLQYTYSWNEDRPAARALFERFTEQTGIRVKNIPVPQDTRDYVDLVRKLLEDGSGVDLLNIDLIWSPILEPHLADLRPHLSGELPLIEPQLLPTYTVNGKLVAVPFNAPLGSLEYRSDLLRDYGYDHPPKTWAELESMAARIQAGERAKGVKDFWGYVWQGAASEGMLCNALEWQASDGGGQIIEPDRTISVNNPAAIGAWERARHWIGWISPPGVVAYREYDSMRIFESGKAAFDRIWLLTPMTATGQIRRIGQRSRPAVVKTGFSAMPGGREGSVGVMGGTGTAVSLHSSHPKEAMALLRFQLHALMQASERESGFGSTESGDIPSLSSQRATIVARPSVVTGAVYGQVSKAYIDAVHSVLTGQKKAREAAAELEVQFKEITGFSTGPPKKPQAEP
jgi:trehalose/maltose transport system substrate-binding protein